MVKAASAVSSIYWPVLSFEEQIDLLNDLSISLTNEFNSDTCDRCTPSHVQYGPDGQTCKQVLAVAAAAEAAPRGADGVVNNNNNNSNNNRVRSWWRSLVPSVPISQSDRGADYLPR